MDRKLVAWGRAVKARAVKTGAVKTGAVKAGGYRHPGESRGPGARRRDRTPPLWLFTDAARLPYPLAAARNLPRGLCGIVLRDDAHPERSSLARALARICRQRRLLLSIAGDWRLAASLGAGVHLRAGCRPAGMPRALPALTSSAHGVPDLLRARRAGTTAFLSPVFATASHPGAPPLGPVRWGLATRRFGAAAALGGITGGNVRRLPAHCRAIGAIGALG